MSLDVYLECPCCKIEVYSANITHNVNEIAKKAGVYMHLWRPDEMEPPITLASELVAPLESAVKYLGDNFYNLMAMEPKNGWGTVGGLQEFVVLYLNACREFPNAKVRVSR